jgi:hypothetical protein
MLQSCNWGVIVMTTIATDTFLTQRKEGRVKRAELIR